MHSSYILSSLESRITVITLFYRIFFLDELFYRKFTRGSHVINVTIKLMFTSIMVILQEWLPFAN